MRIRFAVLAAIAALVVGIATARMGHAQDAGQNRAQYVSLCATTPQALASQASSRDRGGAVGGPFVHRDQVCMIWKN